MKDSEDFEFKPSFEQKIGKRTGKLVRRSDFGKYIKYPFIIVNIKNTRKKFKIIYNNNRKGL